MRRIGGSLTADAQQIGPALSSGGRARLGRGFALSLATHGAAGLFALLLVHAVPMREPPVVAYDLVMPAAPTPAAEPAGVPPAEPQLAPVPAAQPAPMPASLPSQPVEPPEAASETAAPVPSPPVAAAAEPLPAPSPTPLPEAAAAPPAPDAPGEVARPASPQHAPAHRPAVPVRAPVREVAPRRQADGAAGPAAPSAPPAETAASQAALTPPAHPSPAWLAGISAWLLAHRSYPEAARRLGEEGTVVIRFTVDHDGHVLDVTLVRSSGSEALDRAAQSLLLGASLPPFPPGMMLPQQIITVPIRYRLEQ